MKALTLDVRTTPVNEMTDRFYSLGYQMQSDLFNGAHRIEKIQSKIKSLLNKQSKMQEKQNKIQTKIADLRIKKEMIEKGVN